MEDLPLEVGEIHQIRVHHPQGTYPRSRQIEGHRRSQSPDADQKDPGRRQRPLPLRPHLRQYEMPGVPEEVLPLEARVGRFRRPARVRSSW